jgi:hypothetical protein
LQSEDFDVVAMLQKLDTARDTIDRHHAQMILDLCKEGKIPSWALRELDLDLIRLAAK